MAVGGGRRLSISFMVYLDFSILLGNKKIRVSLFFIICFNDKFVACDIAFVACDIVFVANLKKP